MTPTRFLIVLLAVVMTARAEAGQVRTTSGLYTAVVGMQIPDAGQVTSDGTGCIYDVAATGGVDVTYAFDPPACTATVAKVKEPWVRDHGHRTPTGDEPAELIPPFDDFVPLVDPSAPGSDKKKGTSDTAVPLSRGGVSCPRFEGYARAQSTLVHWYGPHNHWHKMMFAEARCKYWENLISHILGEIHPYVPPRDWGAYKMYPAAFDQGWRYWQWNDISITANGTAVVGVRDVITFRNAGYFLDNYVILEANARAAANLAHLGFCRDRGLQLDPAQGPYQVRCYQKVSTRYSEGCYY